MNSIAETSFLPLVSTSTRSTSSIDVPAGETLLFERFLAGDEPAFRELFARMNPRLHTYAARMLRSSAAAEDVTQEIWEKLIGMRSAPPRVSNIGGFLMRMARNACVNILKREKRSVPYDAGTEATRLRASDDGPSERASIVYAAMEKLSFDDRELLVLQYDCGYRLDEIAAMKGSTPEAMWTRASRARRRLRALVSADTEREATQ